MAGEYIFDLDFQKKIFALLLRDIKFFLQNQTFVKLHYFENQILRDLYEVAIEDVKGVKGYIPKYQEPIDKIDLKNELLLWFQRTNKTDTEIDPYYDAIDELYAMDISGGFDYVSDSMRKFAQNREVAIVLNDALKLIRGYKDLTPICYKVVKALEIGNTTRGDEALLKDSEFLKIEFPERKIILDPWLAEQSIGMIAGGRGYGKTWFALSIADAVTTGTRLGNWEVRSPIPCIYLEAEIVVQDFQDRIRCIGNGENRIKPLFPVSDAYRVSKNLPRLSNISDAICQRAIFDLCQKHKDQDSGILLILDNLSVLCPGIDENNKSEWDPINRWLLDLKFAGVITYYLHHTGKGGDQRGTSGHEDNIDTSILLKRPDGYQTEHGCRFICSFTKNRVASSSVNLIQDQEWQLDTKEHPYGWHVNTLKSKRTMQILRMLGDGMKVTEIAKQLNVEHPYISKVKSKLMAKGFLDKSGALTPKGKQELGENNADDLDEI